MAQLENGHETMEGLGGAQANNLFDADEQRLNLTDFEIEVADFPGFPLANDAVRGTRHYDRIVKFVEIIVAGIAPSGAPLDVQLVVGGALKNQVYQVAADQTYAYLAVSGNGDGGPDPFTPQAHDPLSGPGVLALANQLLEVRLITPSGAADVVVKLHNRRRVL